MPDPEVKRLNAIHLISSLFESVRFFVTDLRYFSKRHTELWTRHVSVCLHAQTIPGDNDARKHVRFEIKGANRTFICDWDDIYTKYTEPRTRAKMK